ncbi:hypothetical protein K8A91_12945 [Listeria monocytogenes]|uniref:hypothetical protein n=1 Tax=Listeria monocytogenes TaxID=1639 RepID=UPI000A1E0133|nr:hypothetical protein [Listeria monocytogenes]EAC5804397.1 hypothetical protein [Listeria monocytogenes]EAC9482230.1 hypothetical protein [Listeria monocytogenes]EHL5826348.1 hypothetical protein [Listeria monocytogenes]EKC6210756.1 hypothetical protein [Listeria monocytogenes]MCD1850125.1 hypothetical protein [Listeria monocytogenes]
MSNRVTSIALKDQQLGIKIKATVKEEREIYVEGKRVPCRIFTASSALHPDFEIIVPNLRNSQRFDGRKEVELKDATLVPSAKRNNIGTASRSLELQVFAKQLITLN